MSYPITHVTVKNTPPPRPVISVGRIFPIVENEPEVIFRTAERDEEEESDTETKVVKRGRPRQPKANEDAETK